MKAYIIFSLIDVLFYNSTLQLLSVVFVFQTFLKKMKNDLVSTSPILFNEWRVRR
jgi:hypothetical protein